MNRLLIIISVFIFFTDTSVAQVPDSTGPGVPDSSNTKPPADPFHEENILFRDSISLNPRGGVNEWEMVPGTDLQVGNQILAHHPYFGFGMSPRYPVVEPVRKRTAGKEAIFYVLVFLLLVYASFRRLFPKYFSDLFRLFFRTTIKQRQIKEQLVQTPLPSILLNGFFVISMGLYIAFMLDYFNLNPAGNFWKLSLYAIAGLTGMYFVKFAGLKLSGWIFGMEEIAEAYIFIVFVVNKMMGLLVLPFLILIAFSTGEIHSIALALSWCLIAGLFIYRFILSFAAVRNQVKLNPFHFFLYLLAFELAPLLLIYKGLLLFLGINA